MQATAVSAMAQKGWVLSDSGAGRTVAGGRSAKASGWTKGALVECRIWRQRDFAIEGDESGTMTSTARFKLSLPIGTAIDTRKRFQVQGGQIFEIIGVDDAHAD